MRPSPPRLDRDRIARESRVAGPKRLRGSRLPTGAHVPGAPKVRRSPTGLPRNARRSRSPPTTAQPAAVALAPGRPRNPERGTSPDPAHLTPSACATCRLLSRDSRTWTTAATTTGRPRTKYLDGGGHEIWTVRCRPRPQQVVGPPRRLFGPRTLTMRDGDRPSIDAGRLIDGDQETARRSEPMTSVPLPGTNLGISSRMSAT